VHSKCCCLGDLPYTDAELRSALNCSEANKKIIIKWAKRRQLLSYLSDIVSPILKYQDQAIKIRIGERFQNSKDILAYIHLTLISGDTMALDYLAGTSNRNKNEKCRLCTLSNCVTPYDKYDVEYRDDISMFELGIKGEEAMRALIKNKRYASSNLKSINEDLKNNNISPGRNPLIELFAWQYKHKVNSFFESMPPDFLHTVLKGPVENAIAWGMSAIIAIAHIDPVYKRNMVILEARVSKFPRLHSLCIWEDRTTRFKAISKLFKVEWAKENKGTSFISGSIEGYNLPVLLTQIMFSINKDICPFSKDQCPGNLSQTWNIGSVIVNAMAAALELHFASRVEVQTNKSLTNYDRVVQNCRASLSLLWIMRKDLIMHYKNRVSNTSNNSNSFYNGIKLHLITHLSACKKKYGAFVRTTDTQLLELAHKENVKLNYESTNKNNNSVRKQLLVNRRRAIHCDYITKYYETIECTTSNSTTHTGNQNQVGLNQLQYTDIDNNSLTFKPSTQPKSDVVTFIDGLFSYECNSINAVNTSICSVVELFVFIEKKVSNENREEVERLDEDFVSLWIQSTKELLFTQLQLVKCLHCKSSDSNPNGRLNLIDDFKLWCDSKYFENRDTSNSSAGDTFNVYSFVECVTFYNDEKHLEMAHIVSILNFKDIKEKTNQIYLVVAWLKKLENYNGIMPYPCYQYNYDKKCIIRQTQKPWLSVIESSSVFRPAFLIPVNERGESWFGHFKDNSLPKTTLDKIIFYNVPYDRVSRRSCDGFVRYTNPDMPNTNDNTANISTYTGIIYNEAQLEDINELVMRYQKSDEFNSKEDFYDDDEDDEED